MTPAAFVRAPDTPGADRLPLEDLLRRCRIGVHRYDVESGVITWDAVLNEIWGVPNTTAITYDLWSSAVHPEDRPSIEARVAAALDPDGDGVYDAEYRVVPLDGGPTRWVHATGSVVFDGRRPVRLEGTVQELRARQLLDQQLRDSEVRALAQSHEAAAVYEAAPLGIVLFDTDFRFKRINSRLAEINGLPREDHYGRTIEEILPAETCAVLRSMQPRLLAGEEVSGLEITGFNPRKGESSTWIVAYRPLIQEGRHVTGFLGTIVDISERKEAEAREKLLAREVDHRAKNLLSVVQSLAVLTRAPTVDEYRETLGARLQALARAHASLADARWTGVELATIAEQELAPFCGAMGERCRAGGPPIALSASAAQALALVLHELATNAAKYGALSVPAGRIDLGWSREGDTLRIDWCESGGPTVSKPSGNGFGSRLIQQSIERSLSGTISKQWLPTGLVAQFTVPISRLTEV